MRGRALAICLVTALSWSLPGVARADGGPFGLGVMVGSPTGLSAKLYMGRRNALDFALGFNFLNGRGLHFHMDYLWHPIMLSEDEAFYLPFYFGLGGRIFNHDRGSDASSLHVGVRGPVGILFDFRRVPIDVFFEVALVIDVVHPHGDDLVGLDAAIGFRYYF
jgi:hypothetical protein